jgi:hypothetical protein
LVFIGCEIWVETIFILYSEKISKGGNSMADTKKPYSGDLFIASVINQKSVHQSAQQVLAAIAAQVIYLIEAQFGFSTNDDSDYVDI